MQGELLNLNMTIIIQAQQNFSWDSMLEIGTFCPIKVKYKDTNGKVEHPSHRRGASRNVENIKSTSVVVRNESNSNNPRGEAATLSRAI